MGKFNKGNSNTYENGTITMVAVNSLDVEMGDALKISWEFVTKAWVGDTIIGVSQTKKVFTSDNQTVAKAVVIIDPVKDSTNFELTAWGWVLTFSADLVTSNSTVVTVDGTAGSAVVFSSSSATTLGLIKTQLEALDSITSVTVSWKTLTIIPAGDNVTVSAVVTLWATQATATYALSTFDAADVNDLFDLTVGQLVDVSTKSASTGQVKMSNFDGASKSRFVIVNA